MIGAVAVQAVGGDTRGTTIGAALGGLGGYIWSRQLVEKKRQMERATAGTGAVVTQTSDNQLKLSIPNDISFATGSDAIDNPLSVNRAQSARDYLVSRGAAASRIAIDGRGSREPIADNSTESGRARNRRIDIFLAERVQR